MTFASPVTLAQPLALLALFALVPLAVALLLAARARRAADAAYGGSPALRRGYSAPRVRVRNILLASAVALAAVAIARPQWGTADAPLERRGIDIVLALDISRSMLAADVAPTRAGAAAAGLHDMLRHLSGDRVGLVTFAGSAFVRSPLTLDLDAITDLVMRAQQEGALVKPGTDIGGAISSSVQLLDVPDRARTQVIVLISDGEDLGAGVTEAAAQAQHDGVRIYTVAAGTAQGALVPAEPGARDVVDVTSHADREGLARIASASGGTTRDVATIAGLAVEFARLSQSAFEQDSLPVPVERFQWVLAAALALLVAHTWLAEGNAARTPQAVGARRTPRTPAARSAVATAGLLAALVLPACSGTTAYQQVRAGNEAYAAGQFERALAAYADAKRVQPDPAVDYNIGNALFRRERYEEATVAAKAAITAAQESTVFARATYTLGDAAFRRGALTEARDAFVTVLQRDPTDADARHNLELVLRALTPPPVQQQAPPDGNGTPAPGATPAAGQPTPGAPPPGAAPPGTPPAGPGGDASGPPGTGGAALDPREALRRALEGLPDGVTAEEALSVLDAARRASEASTLGERPGARFDPNDR
jgi:Ca-activated chloride channel family protein